MNTKIEEFKWSLVDLIYDLTTPAVVFRDLQKDPKYNPDKPHCLGVIRMCNSHTIIALTKLEEVLKHFSVEIQSFPECLRNSANAIKKKIECSGAYAFRSQYVAHPFKTEKGKKPRPLTLSEGQALISRVVGNNLNEFYNWVSPENEIRNSVVSLVYDLKEYCIFLNGGSGTRF